MSSEQVNINHLETSRKVHPKSPKKVDINNLMLKIRTEQRKEKNQNLLFFTSIISAISVIGIFISI
tara:strand:+ start:58 stop:255 length:198 start_codon:yes stop_codon:yes gene_type:complete